MSDFGDEVSWHRAQGTGRRAWSMEHGAWSMGIEQNWRGPSLVPFIVPRPFFAQGTGHRAQGMVLIEKFRILSSRQGEMGRGQGDKGTRGRH